MAFSQIIRNNFPILLLLFVSFLKEIIFSAVVPIWHTPDEQAHFAQVSYLAEFNQMPKTAPDLNREILESERILGTERDRNGNNKFTFHPEFKIKYSNSLIGIEENKLRNLPMNYRKELVGSESTYYPPLFYWLSAIPYKIFYNSDLITRLYSARFVSIIMNVLLVYFSWLIGKKIFPERKISQIVLPTLVAFQPMVSFVSAGVNSDNLMNLLFTIFLFLNLLLINKFSLKMILYILLLIILLNFTKPQFILAFPIFFNALIFSIIVNHRVMLEPYKQFSRIKTMILVFLALLIGLVQIATNFLGHIYYYLWAYVNSYGTGSIHVVNLNFLDFFKESVRHTISEVMPWYWGVFDWLGVTYSRTVHKVITRIMILAGIGLIIKLFFILKKRSKVDFLILFLIISSAIYFLGIILFDYTFVLSHGFSFGIQGRYFFPTIVAHMLTIQIGLTALIPSKYKDYAAKIMAGLMITLNFVALFTIAKSYYDLSSLNTFIIQVSQYKPYIFKGTGLESVIIVYLVMLGLYFYNIAKLK